MVCPKCKSEQIIVLDTATKKSKTENSLFRRRKCLICEHRWNTIEIEEENYKELLFDSQRLKSIVIKDT